MLGLWWRLIPETWGGVEAPQLNLELEVSLRYPRCSVKWGFGSKDLGFKRVIWVRDRDREPFADASSWEVVIEKVKVWSKRRELVYSPKASEGNVAEKGGNKYEMACMQCQMLALFSESIRFGFRLKTN